MTGLYRRFDQWCQRHPALSWTFVVALAGDIAILAQALVG